MALVPRHAGGTALVKSSSFSWSYYSKTSNKAKAVQRYALKPTGNAANLLELLKSQSDEHGMQGIIQHTLKRYLAGAKAIDAICSLDFLLYALLKSSFEDFYGGLEILPFVRA